MKCFYKTLLTSLCLVYFWGNAMTQADRDSMYAQGLQAMQDFRFQAALDDFFECQRQDPYNTEYLSKVGYCYYQLGNLPEARIYYQQLLRSDSLHLQALNYLATIEEQLLDYPSALSRIKLLISIDTANAFYYRKAGDLASYLYDREAAMTYYHRATALNPGDQHALVAFCKLLVESGYLLQADSLLSQAIHRQPKNLKLQYEAAKTDYLLRQYEEVTDRFERLLAEGDTNRTYLPLYPYSLAQTEQCEEALPWMEFLLDEKEPREQLLYFLGFCYNKIDSTEKSIAYYARALEEGISPNVAVYHQHLGDIHANLHHHRTALKHYELALEFGNTDPVIYFHMAVAFDHLYKKDKKKPLSFYRKYLEKEEGKHKDFTGYAKKRVEEITYYEKHTWKG